jgi:transcriptional regulator with XRE-family HTH domain
MTSHRLDRRALWQALDTRREQRGISWRAVARETGVASSLFAELRQDLVGVNADTLVSLLAWLGPLGQTQTFTQTTERTLP